MKQKITNSQVYDERIQQVLILGEIVTVCEWGVHAVDYHVDDDFSEFGFELLPA